jgi:hypothetical protein
MALSAPLGALPVESAAVRTTDLARRDLGVHPEKVKA